MAFTTPPDVPGLGFSTTTPVSPAWFNFVSQSYPDLFDATGGGTWQPVGDIIFKTTSNKFKLNYPDINHQIELRGFVTLGLTDIVGMPTGVGAVSIEMPVSFSGAGALDGDIVVTSQVVTRCETNVALGSDPTTWGVSVNGVYITVVATVATLPMPLSPPHGSTLTDIDVWIAGAGGHAGLPANMPTFEILKTNTVTGATISIAGPITDPSPNIGVYQTNHSIPVSGLTEVVDRETYRYHAIFTSEFGVNALAGLSVYGLNWSSTVTTLDIG